MVQSIKNNAKTITLWVGILLALLLLLGTFGFADGAIADLGLDRSIVQKEELLSSFNLEHLQAWSSEMLKVIFAI